MCRRRAPADEHYRAAAPFLLHYRNSFIGAVISVGCSVIFGLFAGYAFAVYRFPLQNFFFILILSTLMMPIQVTSVSWHILMARMHWIDTFPGNLAPNLAGAFGVYFMRQTIRGMPSDLIDAARIDGAGEIRIVLSVMATVALILFIDSWNDFLRPVIVINSQRPRVLPVGIATTGLKG